MACVRQVEFALFDMLLHTSFNPDTDDVQDLLQDVRREVAVSFPPDYNRFPQSFSHIFAGGYAAGYYSYKWAEVLETDAFGAFQEHGIFDQATAQRFRDCVLSKGGTEHPMTLYKRFRGHEPTIDAMLRRDGIKKQ